MITQDGKVALGVPQTDVEDVKNLAHYDHIVGFDDEVGMIHSIATTLNISKSRKEPLVSSTLFSHSP